MLITGYIPERAELLAHRDVYTGESKLTRLKDIENLPKLMVSGALDQLTKKGTIEKSLAEEKVEHQK